MDICFQTCICLWQISQIQTCLRVVLVVGPVLVLTLSAFMNSIASHPSGPHGRLYQKMVIRPPLLGREGSTQFAQGFPDRCANSTACRLCCLLPRSVQLSLLSTHSHNPCLWGESDVPNRTTPNIQGYNITLTTTQGQEAIKQSKNNNSQGPDKLNIT